MGSELEKDIDQIAEVIASCYDNDVECIKDIREENELRHSSPFDEEGSNLLNTDNMTKVRKTSGSLSNLDNNTKG